MTGSRRSSISTKEMSTLTGAHATLDGDRRVRDVSVYLGWRCRRRDRVLNLPVDPGVSHLEPVLGHGVGQRLAGDGVDGVPGREVTAAAGRDARRQVRRITWVAGHTAASRQLLVGDRGQRRRWLPTTWRRLGRGHWLADSACWRRRAVPRVIHAEHLRQTVLHRHAHCTTTGVRLKTFLFCKSFPRVAVCI